jgi:anti-sigma factor RsiW
MNCEIFLEIVGSYVDETLDDERRQWFRDHLRECESCRQSALRQEPSLIFATAAAKPAAPGAVEACATAVVARIRQDRLERRLHHRKLPWMAAAAAMVMAVSAGVIWRSMVGGENAVLPVIETAQELEATASPPTVEVEAMGEEVRVYQLATDGDADTAVYFIVDPALEL